MYNKNQKKKSDPEEIPTIPSLRLKEAATLAEALDYDVVLSEVVHLKQFYRGSFFGKVKLEEIKQLLESNNANAMVINHRLNYIQESKLRELFPNIKIFDRSGAVLEILSQRAQTRNAKLHIELAALKEKKRSLIQLYESDYEADGSNPLAGSAETKWQVQWRAVTERERKVMRELDEIKNQKIEERQARKSVPIIAVTGYINSGKSSLINAITGSQLPVGPQPFSFMDPQIVSFNLPSGKKAIMLDTVGIIGELSDMIYYAYRNTLDEITLADVLINVRDISHPEIELQKKSVMELMNRLFFNKSILESNYIEVWNKSDNVDQQTLLNKYNDTKIAGTIMPTSTKTKDGVESVAKKIDELLKGWKPQ